MTRLEFLRLAGAAAAGWLAPNHRPAIPHQAPVPDQSNQLIARLSRVIDAYDAQGIHRTGTDVDDRSAAWLAGEARDAGLKTEIEAFDFNRVDVRAAFLHVGQQRIEGLPLFDGTFTGEGGVTGRLGMADTEADIALVEVNASGISSEGRSIAAHRRSTRLRAIAAVTLGAHPGLAPMNAGSFAQPFGVPVVQVSSEEQNLLRDHARRGAQATVVADARRLPDRASNVVATARGRRPDLAPLVVMTPRSGWWNCAAERGGGIACWLEACRAVARADPARTTIFVASSGHELGHFGLDAFISKRGGLVKSAAAWIHLGANIGAAGGTPRLQASDDEIERMARDAFDRAGTSVSQRVPRGSVPGGEARNIHVGGGRYVSLLGSSPYFHSVADRWPTAVDAAAVARFASAIGDLVVSVARQL